MIISVFDFLASQDALKKSFKISEKPSDLNKKLQRKI